MSKAEALTSVPLKRLIFEIASGVSVNAVDTPAEPGQLGVLKTSCVYTGEFEPRENKVVVAEELGRVACPVRANTLVVSRMNTPDLVGAAGLATEDLPNVYLPDRLWQVSFDLAAVDPRFIYWWTRSDLYRDQVKVACAGTSSSMQNLDQDSFRSFAVPMVRLESQSRIANFLDDKTARIDALIAEKEGLVSRISEFLQASITALILGENLQTSRKLSNVHEVGDVPAGWEVVPMMRLTHPERPIMYGIVLPGPNVEDGPSVPIVKGGDVRPHRLKLDLLNRTTPEIEAPFARARLLENDIVYSIRGTIGDAELVPAELGGANITQDVARISPRVGVEHRWLLYAAKSRPVFAQLDQLSLGAAVRGINIFDLKRARVPTPPAAVQRQIADELDALSGRVRTLREHSIQHIARLREYRSSLISAAVTGQLDISTFEVPS